MLVPLDIREILESFKKSSMGSPQKAVELETLKQLKGESLHFYHHSTWVVL